MAKIPGNVVGLPSPRSDWNQTNEAKADFIKNKPTKVSQFQNDAGYATTKYVLEKADVVLRYHTNHAAEINPHGTTAEEVGAYPKKAIDDAFTERDARISELETGMGDISAALDELHTYAQALIGGDA